MRLLTNERKMKKSSHPIVFTIEARAMSFKVTVAMATPVKTHATTLTSGPRFAVKSTVALIVDNG